MTKELNTFPCCLESECSCATSAAESKVSWRLTGSPNPMLLLTSLALMCQSSRSGRREKKDPLGRSTGTTFDHALSTPLMRYNKPQRLKQPNPHIQKYMGLDQYCYL